MSPLPTTSPVQLYAMQHYKCLVAALEQIEEETDQSLMVRFATPVKLTSYRGDFMTSQFNPLVAIRSLIAEVEALQEHIKVEEESHDRRVAQRVSFTDAHTRMLESELLHLRSLAFS